MPWFGFGRHTWGLVRRIFELFNNKPQESFSTSWCGLGRWGWNLLEFTNVLFVCCFSHFNVSHTWMPSQISAIWLISGAKPSSKNSTVNFPDIVKRLRKYPNGKGTTQDEWTQFTLCAFVLYLVAPRRLTTFPIFNLRLSGRRYVNTTYVLHVSIRSEPCENTAAVCVFELCATEQSMCSTGFQPPAAAALSGCVISSTSAVFMATKKQAHVQVCTWLSWLSRFIKKRGAHGQTRSNTSPASVRESPAGTTSSGCERCLELLGNAEHVRWWDQHPSARMARGILVAAYRRQWWTNSVTKSYNSNVFGSNSRTEMIRYIGSGVLKWDKFSPPVTESSSCFLISVH